MIDLKNSETMSIKSGIENKVIRMSEALRAKLEVDLGEFVTINKVALQVDRIYGRDLRESSMHAFVTNKVLKQIGVANNVIQVTKHITMGCDPELFLINCKTQQTYCPSFLFTKHGSVGYDGMLAEIRPMPSVNHIEVTKNIHTLLTTIQNKLISKKLVNIHMIAKSSGWDLFAGFHVHLGIPGNLLNPTQKGYGKILRIIIKALDYYVGTLAVLAEGNDCGRRCSPFIAYGKVSDFRVSTRTLEYRVPGGALLKHPGLTKGLIGLCSLVAHDVIARLRIFTEDFTKDIDENEDDLLLKLYPNALKTADMFDVLCSPSLDKTKLEAEKVYYDLECMVNYECYKESIIEFQKLSQSTISEYIWQNWSSY